MRILIITPYPPYPPQSGGRIRMWEQIKFLSLNHKISLVSFIFSNEEKEYADKLAGFCENVYLIRRNKPTDIISSESRLIQEFTTKEMKQSVMILSKEHFDIVLIEHIFMAQYAQYFSAPIVLQEHNIESNILKQFSPHITQKHGDNLHAVTSHAARAFHDGDYEWKKLRKFEDEWWSRIKNIVLVSEQDESILNDRVIGAHTIVVPNGINLGQHKLLQKANDLKVLFMGTLDYYPNIDSAFFLVQQIWPKIIKEIPAAKLVIAGRNPPREVLEFQDDASIEVIPNPQSMDEVAASTSVNVVPIRLGSGTRIKILHAMAIGLPTVSTSLGCGGIDVTNEYDILIREDPIEFCRGVCSLFKDHNLYNNIRRNGRNLVETKYDWPFLFKGLERHLKESAF